MDFMCAYLPLFIKITKLLLIQKTLLDYNVHIIILIIIFNNENSPFTCYDTDATGCESHH